MKLPNIIYTLLIATFLERFSFFLIIPFLSIYLSKNFHFSGFQIGIIISMFAITALFMSFIAAPFIDKINKSMIIYIGLLLATLSFAVFPLISHFLGFILFSIINSIGNSLLSPTYKAMIAKFVDQPHKHLVFNIRYFIINISAVLAPLLSTQVQHLGIGVICNIIVIAYCLNTVVFTYTFFKERNNFKAPTMTRKSNFNDLFSLVLKNKAFLLLIIGQVLFVFGYNVMSSILPQFFAIDNSQVEASKLFALLLSVNGITVLTCQYFVFKFSQITSIKTAIIAGSTLMPIGLFFMGTLSHFVFQAIAMILFTLGEMLVFTMIDIRIDEISEKDYKGSYYSLAGLQKVGALLAPLIGGVLLDKISNSVELFGILSIISFASVVFFIMSYKEITSIVKVENEL
ncbi:MFS transporter [Staphylococcus equorum]|uniref:MFS transporter n=1 Tax=Staphylococcus equorum TaxID=246432 RepID=UPI000852E163|nr:MFS transporter [Staphylococcus equorum]OEL08316.1 MFS transporter [Staphylococcus equorum]